MLWGARNLFSLISNEAALPLQELKEFVKQFDERKDDDNVSHIE